MAGQDYRRQLTDKIIAALEAGTAPWQKPWDGSVVQQIDPYNPVSEVQYRGSNRIWLMMSGYDDPRWCTYKQAEEQGWQVRKGEKSTLIEYWKWSDTTERVNEETGEIEKIQVRREVPIVRYANVFNVSQMDNVPVLERVKNGYEWEPLEMAETIIQRSGVPFYHDQADRAFYRSSEDAVHMPPREAFPNASKYYSTKLHELGHATGHETRLNRKLGNVFGSEDYAKEELRAELASFFLSARLGIEFDVGDHASYVGSWVKVLKEDKHEIFRASRDAELITEYVMNLGLEKGQEKGQEAAKSISVPVSRPEPEKAAPAAFPTSEKPASPAASTHTYINVPFNEKEEAKRLGAKWDKTRKSWYVPDGVDKRQFGKWMDMPLLPANDFEQQFADALRENGLIIPKEGVIMDGKWHRTTVSTSRNAKALKGAYIASIVDGMANGYIQNFDIGVSKAWFPTGVKLSDEQRRLFEKQAEENRRARDAELAAERAEVAAKMEQKWKSLPDAIHHPYLERKGVEAFGLRLDGDRLVTPIRDADGKLWSLQYLPSDPDKPKMYEKGGQKTGNFHLLGNLDHAEAVLFAEGYATAASLHMASGLPVVEVFDSGNIEAVMRALKDKLGGKARVICGDDDVLTQERIHEGINGLVTNEINRDLQLPAVAADEIRIDGSEIILKSNPDCRMCLESCLTIIGVPRVAGQIVNTKTGHKANVLINNVGREKAIVAAEKYGGEAIFPVFAHHVNGLTDFNDLHKVEGREAVARQVKEAVERALLKRTPEECAKAALGEHMVMQLPEDKKRYVGPVIANTATHSVQDIGKQTAVPHDLAKLDRVPSVGKSAKIVYEGGRGTVLSGHEREGVANQR